MALIGHMIQEHISVAPSRIHSTPFKEVPGVEHVFQTRNLPGSSHVYTPVDVKFIASPDPHAEIKKNIDIAKQNLGFAAQALIVLNETHSSDVVVVESHEQHCRIPDGDAYVTNVPGLALGILTADCVPVLLADPRAKIIGAAHAGWKGVEAGILESTIAKMKTLGAQESDIVAVIGPSIRWDSYEVGPNFFAKFVERSSDNERFFKPSMRTEHFLFDLPGMVAHSLVQHGVSQVHDVGLDTFSNPKLFFSYRRQMQQEQRYQGNMLSVIMLS